ncbi:MAG TPA: diguanylate cyclase [Thermoanaerobaculia bacterium]|nr:diguanylate cyclase [Thermoanaerobaculia bacterium]
MSARGPGEIDVLLIESDERAAAILGAMIGPTSFDDTLRISVVPDLVSASLRIRERPPDVVVFNLPPSSDATAVRSLRSTAPEIPLIVLSHEDSASDIALDAGAEDVIPEALLAERTLKRSIRNSLQRHRERRRLTDVTRELQEANRRLEQMALIDPLTELLNRRGLQRALSGLVERLQRDPIDVAVLLIDIDDFKTVNDTLGHAVGDVALREISRRLRNAVRSTDYVARLGGDEFLLLLPAADRRELHRIGERLRSAVNGLILQNGTSTLPVSASVAAMSLTPEMPSIDLIIANAHPLLKQSKSDGKNRVTHDGNPRDGAAEREELCNAICRGEGLFAVSHPVMRLTDGTVAGYEILSRAAHHGTTELPGRFFAACAERNLLTLADHKCFRRCLEFAESLPRGARRHFNLFPSTVLGVPAEHILSDIRDRFDPKDVVLEISESQIIGDPSYLIEPVARLREGKVKIGLDDVGFGNTSIESLLLLEPDVVKLDKRVVRGAGTNPEARRRLERLVEMSRLVATQVIAEGIQNQDDLETAKAMGVRFGQGYLWGRPS